MGRRKFSIPWSSRSDTGEQQHVHGLRTGVSPQDSHISEKVPVKLTVGDRFYKSYYGRKRVQMLDELVEATVIGGYRSQAGGEDIGNGAVTSIKAESSVICSQVLLHLSILCPLFGAVSG